MTGLTYDEADALLKRAKWNVKAAIVMQKATLTLPQALRRLKKAQDSVRVAIGEDVGPDAPRRRQDALRSAAAASSITISTSECSCRNDAGTSVVIGPTQQSLDDRRLGRSGRDEHDSARLKDRRNPHRQGLCRHRCRIAAEERRVGAPRLGLERHAMGPRLEGGRRLVEADVAVGADAENLHVDSAGGGDLTLVARALLLRIGGGAIQEMNPLGRQVDAAEEMRVHEAAKAAGVVGRDADELVEVEGRRARQIGGPLLHARRQLVVEADWRPSGRESEHETGSVRERAGDAVGQRARGSASSGKIAIRGRTRRSHHSDTYLGIRAPPFAS